MVFNRLTVLGKAMERNAHNQILWDCLCECGNRTKVVTTYLIRGIVKSCGCYAIELKTTHGLSKKELRILGYNTWDTMKQRCYNSNNTNYPNYGGRGIKICERWLDSFENFISDMGLRPGPGYSIDRKDPNGDYCPENCQWGTGDQQARNKRRNIWIEHNGVSKIQKDWASHLGISYTYFRILLKIKSFDQIYSYIEEHGGIKGITPRGKYKLKNITA